MHELHLFAKAAVVPAHSQSAHILLAVQDGVKGNTGNTGGTQFGSTGTGSLFGQTPAATPAFGTSTPAFGMSSAGQSTFRLVCLMRFVLSY